MSLKMGTFRIDVEKVIALRLQNDPVDAEPVYAMRIYRSRFSDAGRELKPQVLTPWISNVGDGPTDIDALLDALKPVLKSLLETDELPEGWGL